MKLKKNWDRMVTLPRGSSAEWYTAELGIFSIHCENSDGNWRFKVHPYSYESLPNYATKESAYSAGLLWLRRRLANALLNVDFELSDLTKQVTP